MRDDSGNASPRLSDDSRARTLLIAVGLVAMAFLVYRPDRLRPFHILDFSEFIPILVRGDGLVDGSRGLLEYYASQGRFNAIPYVLLALKWELFSWWTPGWQIARAGMMVTLFLMTYVLLRRLGASRLGALVGGSVFFWAPSAADGWVRMTIAEPLGAAIAIALALRALRFQRLERWGREVAIMALGAVCLLWTKELLAPLLLLPVGLALTVQPDGSFALPAWTRRNVVLLIVVALASLIAIIPIAMLYFGAEDAAYASMYGSGMQSLSGLLAIWVTALVPFELVVVPANLLWALALGGFVLLIATGWRAGIRGASTSSRARWLLAFALLVPLVSVLAYLPNPWYARFYSLSSLVGAALLLGMSATWLQDSLVAGRKVVLAAWAAIGAFALTSAGDLAARTDAVQRRDDWVVAFVADSIDADSVQFATTRRPPYDWLGFGAAMTRISAAKDHPWPPTRNVSCDEARYELISKRGLLTVNFESSCKFEAPLKVISQKFRRFDARRYRFVEDSAHADLVLPSRTGRSR